MCESHQSFLKKSHLKIIITKLDYFISINTNLLDNKIEREQRYKECNSKPMELMELIVGKKSKVPSIKHYDDVNDLVTI